MQVMEAPLPVEGGRAVRRADDVTVLEAEDGTQLILRVGGRRLEAGAGEGRGGGWGGRGRGGGRGGQAGGGRGGRQAFVPW